MNNDLKELIVTCAVLVLYVGITIYALAKWHTPKHRARRSER